MTRMAVGHGQICMHWEFTVEPAKKPGGLPTNPNRAPHSGLYAPHGYTVYIYMLHSCPQQNYVVWLASDLKLPKTRDLMLYQRPKNWLHLYGYHSQITPSLSRVYDLGMYYGGPSLRSKVMLEGFIIFSHSLVSRPQDASGRYWFSNYCDHEYR